MSHLSVEMKLALRTIFFHLLCVFLFAFIYWMLGDHFRTDHALNWMDCMLQSVTIQSGVGFNVMEPISFTAKLAVLFQQLVLISTYVFTLYVFTL